MYLIMKNARFNMKTILSFIVMVFMAVTASAQNLSVTFNGNKNFQVIVDGATFNSNDPTNLVGNSLVFSNLTTGSHKVEIYKLNNRNRSKRVYSSTFNLNQNQDVRLTINNNGSV